jgi:hypothetical protein
MSTRTISFGRIVAVALSATLIPCNALLATPPFGDIQTVPSVPSTPPRGDSNFDWQGLTEGILQGLQQRPPSRRPQTPFVPNRPSGSYRVPLGPRVRPSYPQPPYSQPNYQPQPSYPPQPSYEPPVVTPQRTEPLPPNVVAEPQEVVRPVPEQTPLWEDRVWEVSLRETNCYASALQQQALQEFSSCRGALGKTGGKGTALYDQLEQTQIMLQQGQSWRELEPLMQRILEQNRSTFSGRLSERWQTVMRTAMVCEAFRVAATAAPRGRGWPLDVVVIPTGIIWVVYDPLLPVGTALFVSERLMVCGGGRDTELRLATTTAAEAIGLPVAPGKPEPDISEDEALKLADSIIIRNVNDGTTSVNYMLNGRFNYSIGPGHNQKLDTGRDWLIEFDRGEGREAARYKLTEGTYEFRIVSGRWDLVRVTCHVNIDNSDGKQDFSYLMNNEVVTVKAGEKQELESSQPIVVSFDRGEGVGKPARKNLNKSGTYKIAVDTDTNYLDLFAAETS